jgi:hypothetical protein
MELFLAILGIILLFFLAQLLIFRVQKIYNLCLRTQLYDYAKWVKEKPKVLIMGSSHARSQISPQEIAKHSKKYRYEEIYNIGADAACPFAMYTTYKKNEAQFDKLELVYYTLDPHLLGEKYYLYTKYEKIFLSLKQWRYFTKHHKNYLKLHHQESNKYFFPSIIFFHALEFRRPIFSGRNNGFNPLQHKEFQPFSKDKVAKYIYEPLDVFPVSEFSLYYLCQLKKEIEQKGAKFIFLLTPTYSWAHFYKQEADSYDQKLIAQLEKKSSKGIVLGSLFGEDFGLLFKDYQDDTHLSETGAIKYTKSIFKNIDDHHQLKEKPFKATYHYRLEKSF